MTTEETIAALDRGELRVAEKVEGEWRVNAEAKEAILDYFRIRKMEPIEVGPYEYLDKIPLKRNYAALGVRVTVVSTISSQPPMIADELRRQADVFTDLVELQSKLGRDPSERPAPRERGERGEARHHAPQFLQRATTVAPRGADEDFEE